MSKETTSAQETDPFRISADLLKGWHACRDGIRAFTKEFPSGGTYSEVINRAYEIKRGDLAHWLASEAWRRWIDVPGFVAAETAGTEEAIARLTAGAQNEDGSQNASSGDYSQNEATGANSVIAAAGLNSTFRLGRNGCAAVAYNDGQRARFAIAYVGENVEVGVLYRVTSTGEFVPVEEGGTES